ncbi:uncharacterized protein VTP21DRAFT_7937 [Calcarisporiella thermophila]|uniref:uncharacterized protein n=1 Tax=Calcarisporiella thermophila TaxID=911321 RepID=UPI003742DE7A
MSALGFWGLLVEAGKTYRQVVEVPFRVSMASYGEEVKGKRSCVKVKVDESEYVLCCLVPGSHEQQQLDITFSEGEEIIFSVSGDCPVYLTGNYTPLDEDLALGMDSDEELDEDEENEMEEEDEEEEDEEVEEEDEEMEEIKKEKATAKKGKKEGRRVSFADEQVNGNLKEEKAQEVNQKKQKQESTPNGAEKAAKKLKANNGVAVEKSTPEPKKQKQQETPQSAQKQKGKQETPKPAQKEEKQKTPESAKKASVQKLPNGLIIEDKVVGNGPNAKPGQRVSMRYIGRLKNGKMFDSNTSGKPFTFKLGAGEVIKGWDLGIKGMAVGGERKLTIPAALAYGSRGAPPDIPPNATLTFEVKLLSIK